MSLRKAWSSYFIWYMAVVISTLVMCTGILLAMSNVVWIGALILIAVVLMGLGRAFIKDILWIE
jgi:hypothetical protein